MIYLDYSATTPILDEVLDTYVKVSKDFPGNVNSLHKLGIKSKELQDRSTEQIANLLKIKKEEIIYTSGASESNNTAIKGIAFQYQNRGRHILTTQLEHSSVLEPLSYLKACGFEVEYLKLKSDGTIDLDDLKSKLRDDTILVTIASVSSELGILQPIKEIGKILKDYPKCFFHVDITQNIGKVEVSLENVDLASFSAHKFFGPKGIGVLVKKESVSILPLIHGGKSTTRFRSGTPALPLIVSMSKALRISLNSLDEKKKHVTQCREYLEKELLKIPGVHMNSTEKSIPHILNVSVEGIKPETLLHALEEKDIYISTQSACSTGNQSRAVYAVTKNKEYANSSIRISISYITTLEECSTFINEFQKIIKELRIR